MTNPVGWSSRGIARYPRPCQANTNDSHLYQCACVASLFAFCLTASSSKCQIELGVSIKNRVSPERNIFMATNQNEPVTSTAKVNRLQARETALMTEANRLRARAEHLERVRNSYSSQLRRRQDTHEKVVLGALAKLAGLDVYVYDPSSPHGLKAKVPRTALSSLADTYDRELIVGAMLWLAQSIKQNTGDMVSVPSPSALQTIGSERLAKRTAAEKQ